MTSQSISSNTTADGIPKIIYILYLISIVTGVTAVAGLVLAYVYKSDTQNCGNDHLAFQRRTFWIGLLYFSIASLMTLVVIGFALLPLVYVWIIVRCVRGWKALEQGDSPNKPKTWLY